MTSKQSKAKLKLNTLIDIEETLLRLKIKNDSEFALLMFCAYRPNATLRQIKNSITK